MKIKFHRFKKCQPWQWSKLEKVHYRYYEMSLGRFWVSIDASGFWKKCV